MVITGKMATASQTELGWLSMNSGQFIPDTWCRVITNRSVYYFFRSSLAWPALTIRSP